MEISMAAAKKKPASARASASDKSQNANSQKKSTSDNGHSAFENMNPFNMEEMKDMFRNFAKMKTPQFDREALMDSHRKNMEAIGETNRMAVEVMKSITQLQTQYVRQAFDDMGAMLRDGVNPAAMGPDSIHRSSNAVQAAFSRAQDHVSNVSNVMVNSSQELAKDAQRRIEENMNMFNQMASKYKN
jgi:hypothetical protein